MAEANVQGGGMTRREFLYYIWIASIAVFTAEFTGLFIWFALPRFQAGEFGGLFDVALTEVPPINDPPTNRADGRFWIVNLDGSAEAENELMYPAPDDRPIKGVAAIYKVCTHLGCIYDWNAANNRFECPCHGSKYRLDGRRVESPAPRSLDRFRLIALDENNNVVAESPQDENGFYLEFELPANTAKLQVDTGDRVDGPVTPLLCDIVFGTC
jgi:cytochrome b6-f complex iron-sulfur subunit